MNEISLFLDQEKKQEVENDLNFGVIPAGEKTTKELFIQNNTEHVMVLNIEVKGSDIEVSGKNFEMPPEGMIMIVFYFTPKTTSMQPIKGELNIKIKYIVG